MNLEGLMGAFGAGYQGYDERRRYEDKKTKQQQAMEMERRKQEELQRYREAQLQNQGARTGLMQRKYLDAQEAAKRKAAAARDQEIQGAVGNIKARQAMGMMGDGAYVPGADYVGQYEKSMEQTMKPETFGSPQKGNMGGQPSMFQVGDRGTVRPIKGVRPIQSKGTSLQVSSDGSVRFNQGGTGQELSGTNKSKVQQQALETSDTLAGLNRIEESFDPNFLRLGDRFGHATAAWKEKAGMDVPEDQRQELERYTKWRQHSISTLNQYINDITGAAMGEEEAKRLMKAMPNPGIGLFDGDSPTEFKTKMDAVIKDLKLAIARKTYAMQNGTDWQSLSLVGTEDIINRTHEMAKAAYLRSNPDAAEEEAINYAMGIVNKQFGI